MSAPAEDTVNTETQAPTIYLYAVIPGEPISANKAYTNIPGRGRILTNEARAFKVHLAYWLTACWAPGMPRVPEEPLLLTIDLYGSWETKNGKPRKRDASNTIKLIQDAVADFTGVDDCWHYDTLVRKFHIDDAPEMVVWLHPVQR